MSSGAWENWDDGGGTGSALGVEAPSNSEELGRDELEERLGNWGGDDTEGSGRRGGLNRRRREQGREMERAEGTGLRTDRLRR